MSLFQPSQRSKYRRFEYEPRFYNPERERKLKDRMRIQSKVRRGKPPRVIFLAILLFMVLYFFVKLNS